MREHEPDVALRAGERGTDVIAPLIEQAAARLKPGGLLFIEISPMIAAEVEQLIRDTPAVGARAHNPRSGGPSASRSGRQCHRARHHVDVTLRRDRPGDAENGLRLEVSGPSVGVFLESRTRSFAAWRRGRRRSAR